MIGLALAFVRSCISKSQQCAFLSIFPIHLRAHPGLVNLRKLPTRSMCPERLAPGKCMTMDYDRFQQCSNVTEVLTAGLIILALTSCVTSVHESDIRACAYEASQYMFESGCHGRMCHFPVGA